MKKSKCTEKHFIFVFWVSDTQLYAGKALHLKKKIIERNICHRLKIIVPRTKMFHVARGVVQRASP